MNLINQYSPYGVGSNVQSQGIMRGVVEDNKDPLRLGRIKVRIPSLNGVPDINNSSNANEIDPHAIDLKEDVNKSNTNTTNEESKEISQEDIPAKNEYISTSDLPWAYPCFPNSGFDHGTFLVPEIGDTVLVAFENGSDNPIYLGCVPGYGSDRKYMGQTPDISSQGNQAKDESSKLYGGYGWDTQESNLSEIPSEVRQSSTYEPMVKVIYKSPKGSAIYINEEDEKENLSIVDRLGQIIRFKCPFTKESNARNGIRRGDMNAIDSMSISPTPVSPTKTAELTFAGVFNQILKFLGKRNSSDIYIKSESGQYIQFGTRLYTNSNDSSIEGELYENIPERNSKDDSQSFIVIDNNNKRKIVINHNTVTILSGDKSKIILRDDNIDIIQSGSTYHLEDGKVNLDTGTFTVNADTVINGNVKISGDTSQSGSIHASGDIIAGGANSNHHSH